MDEENEELYDGCSYCHDHVTDPYLTEENDAASQTIGDSEQHLHLFFTTGGRRAPRIEVWQVFPSERFVTENRLVAHYFPKFCPECGRRINQEDYK